MHNKKLLIIGGIPIKEKNIGYGGATVLMQNFIDYLNTHDVQYKYIQTNRFRGYKYSFVRPLFNKLYFILSFIVNIWSANVVMINFSNHSTVNNFPILAFTLKMLKKKVALRKFGGSMDGYLLNVSRYKIRFMIKAMKNIDMIFLETKAAIVHLGQLLGPVAPPIVWFPNSRYPSEYRKDPMDFNKRLVFMSHIKDEKGVAEILEVARLLPEDYEVDLYGCIKDNKYRGFDFSKYNVRYHGEISSNLVCKVLSQSAILLLPSYREGYPGIIIEALSVGIPVVVSDAGGIPEMISDYKEGRIIRAGNVDALRSAILSITRDNYEVMSNNAFNTYNQLYNSEVVNADILKKITHI